MVLTWGDMVISGRHGDFVLEVFGKKKERKVKGEVVSGEWGCVCKSFHPTLAMALNEAMRQKVISLGEVDIMQLVNAINGFNAEVRKIAEELKGIKLFVDTKEDESDISFAGFCPNSGEVGETYTGPQGETGSPGIEGPPGPEPTPAEKAEEEEANLKAVLAVGEDDGHQAAE